jgi:nucleoside-diphosphate-sugar epimerase
MKNLILGDGLLGSELVRQTDWDYISRKKDGIDFTDYSTYEHFLESYNEIINCIAYTDTYSEEKDRHWNVNYAGVADLVHLCNFHNKKLIHISSDYLYTHSKENASEEDVPVHCRNWYGYTKLLADSHIQLKSKNFLLLRGTHKKEPFTYDNAWANQKGNFDYVSVMSRLYIKLIENNANGIYNVGTEVKTMSDLAKQTKFDVEWCYIRREGSIPNNVTMSIDKMNKLLQK